MYQISTRLNYGHPDYYRAIDLAAKCTRHAIDNGRHHSVDQMEEIMYCQSNYQTLNLIVEPMYVLGCA
jgi:hypothetical protein